MFTARLKRQQEISGEFPMDEQNIWHALVDLRTGEQLEEFTEPYDIRTKKQLEVARKKAAQVDPTDGRAFTKVFFGSLGKAMATVRPSSAAMVYTLCGYLAYDSNILMYPNGNPLHTKDICSITKHDKKFVLKAMEELLEAKVFARVKVGASYVYYGNPYLFFMGKKVDRYTAELFKGFSTITEVAK